jgi:hypothetical protein
MTPADQCVERIARLPDGQSRLECIVHHLGLALGGHRRCRDRPARVFRKRHSRDHAAVRAAIAEPWSNGQTEGQITKLKLVKRQMYGRGKLDLLQARLIKVA